ncbi:MAG: FG-GAP repeat protein [Planctomycetota bacterium]
MWTRRRFCPLWLLLGAMGLPEPTGGQCNTQEVAKLIASNAAAADYFGVSVALDADTLVIGAYGDDYGAETTDSGAAYVFVRAGGVWSQQAYLIDLLGNDLDYFGYSVAIDGDTAVIGAYLADVGNVIDAGAAYVFVRSGGVWTQQAKLVASDAAEADWFGYSVAVSGNTAVVGAHQRDAVGKADAGAAYVFVRAGTVWTQQAVLTASDTAAFDYLGRSVALADDTAVAGASSADLPGKDGAGAAYVFFRTGSVWTPQAKLTASDAAAFDNFGFSVALADDTAVVGAIYDDHPGGSNAGSAYVFARSAGVWTSQGKLTAVDAAASDAFGRAVAVSGNMTVIGANQDDHAGGSNAGSAYVFVRFGTVWTQRAKLTAADAAASDHFGSAAVVDGRTAVIGAMNDDLPGGADAGSSHVFLVDCLADPSIPSASDWGIVILSLATLAVGTVLIRTRRPVVPGFVNPLAAAIASRS